MSLSVWLAQHCCFTNGCPVCLSPLHRCTCAVIFVCAPQTSQAEQRRRTVGSTKPMEAAPSAASSCLHPEKHQETRMPPIPSGLPASAPDGTTLLHQLFESYRLGRLQGPTRQPGPSSLVARGGEHCPTQETRQRDTGHGKSPTLHNLKLIFNHSKILSPYVRIFKPLKKNVRLPWQDDLLNYYRVISLSCWPKSSLRLWSPLNRAPGQSWASGHPDFSFQGQKPRLRGKATCLGPQHQQRYGGYKPGL